MPKSKNPEAKIIEYFENAPYEAARAVHSIAKRILAKRSSRIAHSLDDIADGSVSIPAVLRKRKSKPSKPDGDAEAEEIGFSNPSYQNRDLSKY